MVGSVIQVITNNYCKIHALHVNHPQDSSLKFRVSVSSACIIVTIIFNKIATHNVIMLSSFYKFYLSSRSVRRIVSFSA
jgi:hypothetical protein